VADLVEDHLARVKTGLLTGYSLKRPRRLAHQAHTLRGEPFSFEGHEYQKKIVALECEEALIRKCSQIGLSELSDPRLARDGERDARLHGDLHLAHRGLLEDLRAHARGSDHRELAVCSRSRVHPDVNNGEVKQFGESFLYFRGTKGVTAAISVPADVLVHDEYDFSDLEVLSTYQSRLTHSKYKWKRKFSTPTINGYGISAEFENAEQHWNMVKCCHCNHWFLPDYFQHVVVPGWDEDLKKINADNLHHTRYREAQLHCPECGEVPSLMPEHREWVIKNPDNNNGVVAIQVQPFDAPLIISCGDLIKASTTYERYADFVNFNLGLPCEDKENSFSKEELDALFVPAAAPHSVRLRDGHRRGRGLPRDDWRCRWQGRDRHHPQRARARGLAREAQSRACQ
jgi:hypothetical protein